MDYYCNFKAHESKLAELLTEHSLVHTFRTGGYPITLTISRNAAPEEQMSMLLVEGATSSQDAKLIFIFDLDGIEVNTYERLVISDKLFTKIKGLAKKMYDSYCHAFFAEARTSGMNISDGSKDAPDTSDKDNPIFDDFYTEPVDVIDAENDDVEDEDDGADE